MKKILGLQAPMELTSPRGWTYSFEFDSMAPPRVPLEGWISRGTLGGAIMSNFKEYLSSPRFRGKELRRVVRGLLLLKFYGSTICGCMCPVASVPEENLEE